MIKTTLHLAAGTQISFHCPIKGPLYDQVAGIASMLADPKDRQDEIVELPMPNGKKINITLGDVLAVETKPAHGFEQNAGPTFQQPLAPLSRQPTPIPEQSPPGPKVKMTIGMATYDDYDGVYFTIQAIRLYHPEILADVEFIIIDNNPSGACAEPLKALEKQMPNYRYVPLAERSGTTVRDFVFSQSNGEFVLCMDCHVFVVPGALKKLLDYFDADPQTNDLLQGPLLYDDLSGLASHFKPEWNGGMYGQWDMDPAAAELDADPIDIPMQGLGLFACKRTAWPGFSEKFTGFGGEEGYIHEKFRQLGGRTLCLPFLRWVHRFNRPLGVPYRNKWEDRISNYLHGFSELGLDIEPVKKHFTELLGEEPAARIIDPILKDLEENK